MRVLELHGISKDCIAAWQEHSLGHQNCLESIIRTGELILIGSVSYTEPEYSYLAHLYPSNRVLSLRQVLPEFSRAARPPRRSQPTPGQRGWQK